MALLVVHQNPVLLSPAEAHRAARLVGLYEDIEHRRAQRAANRRANYPTRPPLPIHLQQRTDWHIAPVIDLDPPIDHCPIIGPDGVIRIGPDPEMVTAAADSRTHSVTTHTKGAT